MKATHYDDWLVLAAANDSVITERMPAAIVRLRERTVGFWVRHSRNRDTAEAARLSDLGHPDATNPKRAIAGLSTGPDTQVAINGQILAVSRQRFGRRALFTAQQPGLWGASTNPLWLCAAMGLPLEPDVERLRFFVAGVNDTGRNDFLKGLCRVCPGETASLSPQGADWVYARTTSEPTPTQDSYDTQVLTTRQLVLDAHAALPRQIAATLSGGVDSPGIAAAWLQTHPGPLRCISMTSTSLTDVNESHQIAHLRDALDIEQMSFDVDAHWPFQPAQHVRPSVGLGPTMSPLWDTAVAFLTAMRPFTGDQIMFGMGADVVMDWSDALVARELIQTAVASGAWRALAHATPALGARTVAREALRLGIEGLGLHGSLEAVLASRRRREVGPGWMVAPVHWQPPAPIRTPGATKQHGLHGWAWEGAVRWMESLGRATNTECIEPMLDDDLFDYLLTLPATSFRCGQPGRRLWRDVVATWLPATIAYRRKAQTFLPLFARGFVREQGRLNQQLEEGRLARLGVVDTTATRVALNSMIGRLEDCGQDPRWAQIDEPLMSAIWRTLSAELWLRDMAGTVLE